MRKIMNVNNLGIYMMARSKIITCMMVAFLSISRLVAHDVLVELKSAVFVPTADVFKDIYGTCGEFGVEITAGRLWKDLYAFASIDFLTRAGQTVELDSYTRVAVTDFALGFKYLFPVPCGDVYLGLGVKPTNLYVYNHATIPQDHLQWGCGGVAKIGAIFNLPYSLFIDTFIDYSFVDFKGYLGGPETIVDGCLLGLGFGCRFN